MKLLIISDSHDNIVRLRHVLGFAEKLKVGAIIHLGDWYRVVPEEIARVKNIPVYTVLGNADYRPELREELQQASIKYSENFLELELDNKKIGLSHYPSGIRNLIDGQKYDLLLHGHTHKRKNEVHGKTRVLNPGALQGTQLPSFAVYDTSSGEVEFVDIAQD